MLKTLVENELPGEELALLQSTSMLGQVSTPSAPFHDYLSPSLFRHHYLLSGREPTLAMEGF